MRCLIDFLYAFFFGLRMRSHEQYIADLEQMLSEQLDARAALETQIEYTTHLLLDAHQARDEALAAPSPFPPRRRQADGGFVPGGYQPPLLKDLS